MEDNPSEAIKNNVMGATKRLCEIHSPIRS